MKVKKYYILGFLLLAGLIYFNFYFKKEAVKSEAKEEGVKVASSAEARGLLGAVLQKGATDHFWFIDPLLKKRAFIGSPSHADQVIKSFGLEINNNQIAGILPAVADFDKRKDSDRDGLPDELESALGSERANADTDKDGVSDGEEIKNNTSPMQKDGPKLEENKKISELLKGAIILQSKGKSAEAWYVHPVLGKRYHLGTGENAFRTLKTFAQESSLEDIKVFAVSEQSPSWLVLPPGYASSIVAGGFARPRVLALDPEGHLMVSDYGEKGRIVALTDPDHDGIFQKNVILNGFFHGLTNLFNAHGLAFAAGRVYVASEHVLEYWRYDAKNLAVEGKSVKVMDVPPGAEKFPGQGHMTRTVIAGQDGNLYLSIGSSCDSCFKLDENDYAVIKKLDPDGKKVETVARGLRNTVFFVMNPQTDALWGNDMGQDGLGDDLPPDELNIIALGNHYGWPHCYGNRIPTPETPNKELCSTVTPPAFYYGAHNAPLGLRFIPNSFKESWAGDILSSLHGSTIRKKSLVGYKVVRIDLDQNGKPKQKEDVITGFIRTNNIIVGRPVDLIFDSSGALFISDDFANVVHRVIKK